MNACLEPACGRPLYAKRLCVGHYAQQLRGQKLRPLRGRRSNGVSLQRDELGRKACSRCGEWKPEADFRTSPKNPDGLAGYCAVCQRSWTLEQKYGITLEQYDAMALAQGGVCPICHRTPRTWSVDHDHSCCDEKASCGGCVRGLLCNNCNAGLGLFRDDLEALARAINYLGGGNA